MDVAHAMKWEQLCKLGRELPGVEEGTWYGTPALNVRGKAFLRLKEDGQSVVFRLADVEEQEFLLEVRPAVYFITDHYRGYPAVLARLAKLTTSECRFRLERGWRLKAPRKLVEQFDAKRAAPPSRRGRR
jgi:hypothetical protein